MVYSNTEMIPFATEHSTNSKVCRNVNFTAIDGV